MKLSKQLHLLQLQSKGSSQDIDSSRVRAQGEQIAYHIQKPSHSLLISVYLVTRLSVSLSHSSHSPTLATPGELIHISRIQHM